MNLMSSGRYRCEVSAEAPSFQTVSDHSDMLVIGEASNSSIGNSPESLHDIEQSISLFIVSSSGSRAGYHRTSGTTALSGLRCRKVQLHFRQIEASGDAQLVHKRRAGEFKLIIVSLNHKVGR